MTVTQGGTWTCNLANLLSIVFAMPSALAKKITSVNFTQSIIESWYSGIILLCCCTLLFVQLLTSRASSWCKHDKGALLWLNVETPKRTPIILFGQLVRCSTHGRSFARLWYKVYCLPQRTRLHHQLWFPTSIDIRVPEGMELSYYLWYFVLWAMIIWAVACEQG